MNGALESMNIMMGSILVSQTMLLGGIGSYITLKNLFGAVIALAVIVLIMIITYFVNIKPNLNDNSLETSASESNPANSAVARTEEKDLIHDQELVAVITAAIYATMGDAAPKDGLVVRSIRRVNSKNWMNS